MKKQINQSALLLLLMLTILSCTDSVVEKIEDKTDTIEVETINPSAKGISDEWQNPQVYGLFGPSNLDALQKGTYNYIGHPNVLSQIPSHLRRFSLTILRENNSQGENTQWDFMGKWDIPYSVVSLRFPATTTYPYPKKTKWKVSISMSSAKSSASYTYDKEVTVNN